MQVLLAGASGAIGRCLFCRGLLLPHQVVGTTRSEKKADLIRRLGGEALIADGLDAGAIDRAVRSAKADAIVHQMTNLKAAADLRHFERGFAVSHGRDRSPARRRKRDGSEVLCGAKLLRAALCQDRRRREVGGRPAGSQATTRVASHLGRNPASGEGRHRCTRGRRRRAQIWRVLRLRYRRIRR
jgi:hypothetical protein